MNKKLFLVPLIALILASCNSTPSESSIESKQKEQSSLNISSEDKSSSKNNTSTTTSSFSQSSSSQNSSSSNNSSTTSEEDNIVSLELFALNDMHGNVEDSSNGLGIAKTSTLLKTYPDTLDDTLYISQGDMWQGSAPSNLTHGLLVNDWMNQLNFTSMTVGNHEFDWSTSYVKTNAGLAEFPYLGINVYSHETDQRVDYLDPSVIVNKNGVKVGIIGAIGDCYGSIAASMVQDIYFKVGEDLTNLVKQEATRLRNEEGCDMIIYSLHEGSESTSSLDTPYDTSLSNGYVDLVLEGHTHKNYVLQDSYGVYHIQSAGYNKSINYIKVDVNTTKNTCSVVKTKSIYTNDYKNSLSDDTAALALFTKYEDQISGANEVLGYNSSYRSDAYLEQLVADLYLQYGLSKWGSTYNIYLGGGYIKTRSPYSLSRGDVTYADLLKLFPFNNDLQLCSISGYNLNYKFVNTFSEDYYIKLSSYGEANTSINFSATYYVVVDNYTSDYTSNGLTVIENYTAEEFYARDMLAEYIRNGGLA